MFALQALSLGLLASQAFAFPATSQQSATAALPTTASSSTAVASSQLDQLADFAYNVTTDNVSSSKRGGCTLQNLRVRRDWRAFTTPQKKAYINSVLCLQKLPSRTPAEKAPGAKTRYDDFVATHIDQTLRIHYTV
jgi:tyrosinase